MKATKGLVLLALLLMSSFLWSRAVRHERCHLNFPVKLSLGNNHLAYLTFDKRRSVHEVEFTLRHLNGEDLCTLGLRYEGQEKITELDYNSTKDSWFLSNKYLPPSGNAVRIMYKSQTPPHYGRYDFFGRTDSAPFFVLPEPAEKNRSYFDQAMDFGAQSRFTWTVAADASEESLAFVRCIEAIHDIEPNKTRKHLSCGSWTQNHGDLMGVCNVTKVELTLANDSKASNPILTKVSLGLEIDRWKSQYFFLRCSIGKKKAEIPFVSHEPVSVIMVMSITLLMVAGVAVVAVTSFLFFWRHKYRSLWQNKPFLCQVSKMPVSLSRQNTNITYDEKDEEASIEREPFFSAYLNDSLWPEWILQSKLMRFPREDLEFDETKPLGNGNYGFVFNGVIKFGTTSFDVAIKQAKNVDCENQDDLLREAEKLSKLRENHNIVNIKGIALEIAEDGISRKYSLVLSLLPSGNLEDHLKKERDTLSLEKDLPQMVLWSYEIARGMKFIGENGIVHLDLATRNILLTHPNKTAKISDFGLSKFVTELSSDCMENKALPIRWLPPDVWWDFSKASTATDVWAFGVLMWEIFTRARKPYDELIQNQAHYNRKSIKIEERLAQFLHHGNRLQSPWRYEDHFEDVDSMPMARDLYKIMCDCWSIDPLSRPRFHDLIALLKDMIDPETYERDKRNKINEQQHYLNLTPPKDVTNFEYLELAE